MIYCIKFVFTSDTIREHCINVAAAAGSIFLPLKTQISDSSPTKRFSQSKISSWLKFKDIQMNDI